MSAEPVTEAAGPDVGEVGSHVEQLLDRIAATGASSAELAEELVRALVQLYGAGLERIVSRLGAAAPDVLDELAGDVLVAGLLSLHDLHPRDVRQRVEAALAGVRPALGSHGGDVTLLDVREGVVFLRLEGTCNGCGSSQVTLEQAVEGAIASAAPEITRIDVEGAVPASPMVGGLIPAESLLRCPTELATLGKASA